MSIQRRLIQLLSCKTYAWLIWLIASLFYGLEYFQRVAPTVMAEPLMQTFHINATTLGTITSLYFYAYACAQIPVGLLFDHYSTSRLLALSCAIISLGSLLFALTKLLILLAAARLIIGLGSAFAFIGVLKLAGNWYSSNRYPLMVGLTNTLGVVGAIFGEGPLASMIDHIGWSNSLIVISFLGFVISLLIAYLIKDNPSRDCVEELKTPKQKTTTHAIKKALKSVLTHQQTWLAALYAGLMVAPIIAFAELWAVPFLVRDYHISSVLAAELNTAIFVGIGIGGPINGWLAGKMHRPKKLMLIGNLTALLILTTVIYTQELPYFLMTVLLFVFGFATSSMLLIFTLNKNHHPLTQQGMATAFTNMIIMIIGAIYQPLIGMLLDFFMPVKTVAHYNLHDFHIALTLLPVTLIVSLFLLLKIKVNDLSIVVTR